MSELTGEELDWRDRKRARVLEIFRGELGAGRPEHYWSIVGPSFNGRHWCGGMCLWALREAGLAPGVMWESDAKRRRYGFCFRLKPVTVREAKPADVVYFNRYQHHALFVGLDRGMVVTVDGNQTAPERVRECRRPVSSIAAVYSIEPFLAAALEAEAAKAQG